MPSPFLVILAAAGVTFWITQSEMGEPIRNTAGRIDFFARMFQCSFCTGFWVGLFAALATGAAALHDGAAIAWLHDGLMVLLVAFAAAIVALVLDALSEMADALSGLYALQARVGDLLEQTQDRDPTEE